MLLTCKAIISHELAAEVEFHIAPIVVSDRHRYINHAIAGDDQDFGEFVLRNDPLLGERDRAHRFFSMSARA